MYKKIRDVAGQIGQEVASMWDDDALTDKARSDRNKRLGLATVLSAILFLLYLVMDSPTRPSTTEKQGPFVVAQHDTMPSNSSIQSSTTHDEVAVDHPTLCAWGPESNQRVACKQAIKAVACRAGGEHVQGIKVPRLLFLGDSTMLPIFESRKIKRRYADGRDATIAAMGMFTCRRWERHEFGSDRCNLNEQIGLPYRPGRAWTPPRAGYYEGPVKQGLETPYCQDRRQGLGDVMDCKPVAGVEYQLDDWVSTLTLEQKNNLTYASFVGVEFARDVEVQTEEFLTTQENLAQFLSTRWNTDDMRKVYEKPTCVISTGHHDVLIPDITQDTYVANVQWYLNLMAEQCETILWVAVTAPETDKYPQKIKQTREWGLAVHAMIDSDPILMTKTLYMDGYVSSKTYEHRDNVHLTENWYKPLGAMFSPQQWRC